MKDELIEALNVVAKADPDRDNRTGYYILRCVRIAEALRDSGIIVCWDKASEKFQRGEPDQYQG